MYHLDILLYRKFTWRVDIWVSPWFQDYFLLENLEPIQLREKNPFTKFVLTFQRSLATRMGGTSVQAGTSNCYVPLYQQDP